MDDGVASINPLRSSPRLKDTPSILENAALGRYNCGKPCRVPYEFQMSVSRGTLFVGLSLLVALDRIVRRLLLEGMLREGPFAYGAVTQRAEVSRTLTGKKHVYPASRSLSFSSPSANNASIPTAETALLSVLSLRSRLCSPSRTLEATKSDYCSTVTNHS